MLQRKPSWDVCVLPVFLQRRAGQPFEWGSGDCLHFAADGILAVAGVDVAAEFRGRYRDPGGALRTMREVAGSTDMLQATGVIAKRYHLQRRDSPLMAGRGDVVLVPDVEGGKRLICALVGLSGRWVHAPGATGLRNICITQVQHCWTY